MKPIKVEFTKKELETILGWAEASMVWNIKDNALEDKIIKLLKQLKPKKRK